MVGWFVSREVEVATPYSLMMTVLNCASVWTLLGGIIDHTAIYERFDLAERASSRRLVYVLTVGIATTLGLIAVGSGGPLELLALPLFLAALIVAMMISYLIHRVRYELPNDTSMPH